MGGGMGAGVVFLVGLEGVIPNGLQSIGLYQCSCLKPWDCAVTDWAFGR